MDQAKRRKSDLKIYYAIVATAIFFMAAGTLLTFWSEKEMRATLRQQFNEQQAVMAHSVADVIERRLALIQKELLLTGRDLTQKPDDIGVQDQNIGKMFSRLIDYGVRKAEIMDLDNRSTLVYTPYRNRVKKRMRSDYPDLLSLFQYPESKVICLYPSADNTSVPSLALAVSLSGTTRKLLVCEINVNWFLSPLLKNIRSGKTGYAWIIDENGTFVYHPDAGFVRKSAFTARKGKSPDFSFHRINFIQKEKMLKGMAGTGLYDTTWHRGITGKIEKLIAYCPVIISDNPLRRWSVAVVAPVSEIEDEIKKGILRRFVLQGLVILVVTVSALALFLIEKRWSRLLEKTVDRRTEAYKRSEEKYRSLVESAEDFIFSVDDEGRFLSMNHFTAKFFGGRAPEFIGMQIADLFDTDVAKRQVELINLVSRFGKSVRDEFEIKLGKHTLWISANFMPLKDKEGSLNAILCIARDITENRELEHQLVNTEKLASIGTLAAGVAHEVNNPLGVILGFCDLLIQKTTKDTQLYQDLKVIERQGLHCKKVVENLLSFSRLEKGSSDYTDVNSCLGEVISVVRHTLEMNHIELKTDLYENIPLVGGDFRQLQQVLMNLVNNAVAAMAAGGKLHISTRLQSSGKKVVIRFSDNGIGISSDDMDHIFEPFFTTKPEGEGTGLGLFVSYGIITKYGGSIECKSQPAMTDGQVHKPGWTTFTVRLPVK